MFWLALGYPLLAHLAILLHDSRLEWLALVWLLTLSLWGALIARRGWAWAVLLGGAAALYGLVVVDRGRYALYVPPAVIPAALFIVFARSLRGGEMPLIGRVATIMRGEPLPAPLVIYTRQLTIMWCGIFVVLFASAIGFAVWARPELWSLMTNIVHYLILGAVFVVEFIYRRIRFRELEPWGLFEYLRRLARTNVRV